MNWTISYQPLLPLAPLVILAVIAIVLIVITLYVRQRGGLLRGFSLACLFAALLNPGINQEVRQPLSDIAVLLVDQSASQSIANRIPQTTQAVKQLKASIAGLKNVEIRTAIVTSGLSTGTDGTHVFKALQTTLKDIPPERYAGTILITDGQVHDVPKTSRQSDYNGPLHVLLTGTEKERDRRVLITSAPKYAIVGESQTIKFKIEQSGGIKPGERALVNIAVGGKFVRQLKVNIGQTVKLTLDVPHGGANIVEISVNAFKGELSRQNNRAIAMVQGIRDRLRVLLVSGKPHPGERTWRNLLKADPSVDLVHFTILRPPQKQDGTPINELSLIAFPTRELFSKKLHEFDLVIFDRYARHGVLPGLYLYNIAEYVKNGGAVLVAAGPDYAGPASIYHSPLADVLPAIPTGIVTLTPYRPQLTTEGSRHPIARDLKGSDVNNPAWGKWFRLIETDHQTATTLPGTILMSGPQEKPLLLVARAQKGRIAQLMSDHSWLWARGYDGGGPQAELLRRMAHWLMREPDLEEEKLSGKQNAKQLVISRQTMADKAAPVTITTPSGKTRKVILHQEKSGLWQARINIDEAGIHKLEDDTKTTYAGVGSPDPRETGEIHSTGRHLQKIVATTDGSIKRIENGIPRLAMLKPNRALAGSGWIGLKANGVYDVKSVKTLPLFSTLLALAALLALICAMWYREGR